MSFPAYDEYKDSGFDWLGKVPEHWQLRPLGSCFRERREKVSDTDYAPLSVTKNGIVPQLEHAAKTDDNDNRKCVLAGDFVINSRSDRNGSSGMATEDGSVSLINTVLRPNDDIDIRFAHHLFRSVNFQEEFYRFGKGIVADLWSTNYSAMKGICLAIPTADEQEAISSFLDVETSKIDGLVSEQRRLIELLKEKRQAVISHAVTKGLNPDAPMKPSGIQWLGDVPQHWRVKRLKHISPFISVGIVVNPTTYVSEVADDLPFIYGGDIREGVIDWENSRRIHPDASATQEKTRLEAGDLLVVRVGAPGVTAVVPDECEGGNCASVMLMRKGDFDSDWLCFAMNTRVVRFQVEIVQYGAAQKQFNIAHAVNFWVPVPVRGEQDEIVSYLKQRTGEFDTLQAEAERAIELLQERRTALISAAVTGKIDVREFVQQVAV